MIVMTDLIETIAMIVEVDLEKRKVISNVLNSKTYVTTEKNKVQKAAKGSHER
jgi:hypothetical protein